MTVAQVLAFIAIWIAVPLAFALIASLLTKAMEAVSLGWLNRWLGFRAGSVKVSLLVSLLIGVIEFIDEDNTLLDQTKKERIGVILSYEIVCRDILSAAKHVTEQYILNE